jgi:hypothetical protein
MTLKEREQLAQKIATTQEALKILREIETETKTAPPYACIIIESPYEGGRHISLPADCWKELTESILPIAQRAYQKYLAEMEAL